MKHGYRLKLNAIAITKIMLQMNRQGSEKSVSVYRNFSFFNPFNNAKLRGVAMLSESRLTGGEKYDKI